MSRSVTAALFGVDGTLVDSDYLQPSVGREVGRDRSRWICLTIQDLSGSSAMNAAAAYTAISRWALSDRGELSASQFGVDQEAERIQQLALLHQPDQNRLPELG